MALVGLRVLSYLSYINQSEGRSIEIELSHSHTNPLKISKMLC